MTSDIYQTLEANGIEYTKAEHEAVFTVAEANLVKADIQGAHTKNLFLKNKDASQYYLYVIASHKRADLKKLKEQLGESKLNFGSPEELAKFLNVTPGSVSAMGLLHDTQHDVRLLIDRELWESDLVNAHPNANTATLTFTQEHFRKFLELTGHSPVIVEA